MNLAKEWLKRLLKDKYVILFFAGKQITLPLLTRRNRNYIIWKDCGMHEK